MSLRSKINFIYGIVIFFRLRQILVHLDYFVLAQKGG